MHTDAHCGQLLAIKKCKPACQCEWPQLHRTGSKSACKAAHLQESDFILTASDCVHPKPPPSPCKKFMYPIKSSGNSMLRCCKVVRGKKCRCSIATGLGTTSRISRHSLTRQAQFATEANSSPGSRYQIARQTAPGHMQQPASIAAVFVRATCQQRKPCHIHPICACR